MLIALPSPGASGPARHWSATLRADEEQAYEVAAVERQLVHLFQADELRDRGLSVSRLDGAASTSRSLKRRLASANVGTRLLTDD